MKLFFSISRLNPRQSIILVICLVLGGLADGIGASTLVPFVSEAARQTGNDSPMTGGFDQTVRSTLELIGLQPTMGLLFAIVVGAVIVKGVLLLIANRQIGYCVAHMATDLRLALLRALLRTRWSYYVHQPVGSFANSISSEAQRASESYLCAAQLLSYFADAVISFVVALMVSWKAGVLAVFAASTVAVLLRSLVRKARRAGRHQTRLARGLLSRLTDILQGIKPLKAMSREMLVGPLLELDTRKLNRALEKKVIAKASLNAIQDSVLLLLLALGLYLAVALASLPLSTVIALALLSQRILSASNKMQKEYQKMVTDESAYWAMHEMIVEAEGQREQLVGTLPAQLERAIVLDGVGFAYDEQDRWILRRADLSLPVGDLTVLVGPSGAGKTTAVDLVVGLIQPQEGQVLLDDVRLRDINTAEWRQRIGYVPQDTFLLHDTVRMNITLGDPTVTESDVSYALRAAGVGEVVAALPEGLDTIVGERGLRLSGGQRQRIAMARALVRKPRLLILDEATTALDPVTEQSICETLRQLRSDMAIVAICHQGALIDEADRVYRVAESKIALVRDRTQERVAS